jgi:AmiR/NasT family two-component response regulator
MLGWALRRASLGAAAKAELSGALADQLQVALNSRVLIERAKGALMERERLDDQEAFTHLRQPARSSRRKLTDVAREVADGQPLARGRTRPTPTPTDQGDGETDAPQRDT